MKNKFHWNRIIIFMLGSLLIERTTYIPFAFQFPFFANQFQFFAFQFQFLETAKKHKSSN